MFVLLLSAPLIALLVAGCGAGGTSKVSIQFPVTQSGLENQNSGSAELTSAVLSHGSTLSFQNPTATIGGSFESSTATSSSYRVTGGIRVE